jgi:hypothetical protein
MKTILAAFLAVAFLASTPAFAGDKPEGGDKPAKKGKKGDKKSGDEKKDEGAKTGGGW